MSNLLIIIYVFFALGHLSYYLKNIKNYLFVNISTIFIFFLMSGHIYVGNGDAKDFSIYFKAYTDFETLELENIWFYYLFYLTESIGKHFLLNFYQWWAVMTALSLIFIIRTIKKRKYNPHLFFVFFMCYYVFMLYGGLKFFYGFCIFQYAFTFLIKGEKKDRLKFILLTLLAGGFHVMYYIFLVFGLVYFKIKNRKYVIKTIVVFSLGLTVFIKITGASFLDVIQGFIDGFENEKLTSYSRLRTNWGFLIPVFIHVLTTIYAFMYRNIVKKYDQGEWYFYANSMVCICLMAVVFYPTFMIALTFMRLLTALSLTIIIASSYGQKYFNKREKLGLVSSGFAIIGLYSFVNIYLGGYLEKTVLPFFESYYFNWI